MNNDDTPTDDIITTATRSLTQHLETDLRGAYRANYDYLYVGHPLPTAPIADPNHWNVHIVTHPSNHEFADVTLPDDYRWACYDLTAIEPDEYREAVDHE